MPLSLAREQMIEQQVRAWEVLDARVLSILRTVAREQYVPDSQRFLAFADVEIPLANSQHMLRPSVAGRLLQALELSGSERVLEVGAGSGFLTACLAKASAHVRSLEVFPDLAELARAHLAAAGVGNTEVITGDAMLSGGPLENAAGGAGRYHAIAVTGSLPVYDNRFERMLEIGGRLFVIVGDAPVMDARLVRRVSEDGWVTTSLFETVVDPLINARRPPEFAF
jgi:protein-L-isoaspartate(D-aspartate) O-methyltransferase